jgi:hypothetical protein
MSFPDNGGINPGPKELPKNKKLSEIVGSWQGKSGDSGWPGAPEAGEGGIGSEQ